MVAATQFALSNYMIEFQLPSDQGIWYIGSDNSSDGIRVLRIDNTSESGSLKIVLGNFSVSYHVTYTAAFAIVNEDETYLYLNGINVSSENASYLRIWIHGDPYKIASEDNTSVLLYDNGTLVHPVNRTIWVIAPGDQNANTTCSNITDRSRFTNRTLYDPVAKVRYTYNNLTASSNYSDFVWVQIELSIPDSESHLSRLTGSLYIHYARE